jgi:hypothetical protein
MKTLLTIGAGEVKIQFRHQQFTEPQLYLRSQHGTRPARTAWVKAITTCRLITGRYEAEHDVIPHGQAKCVVEDAYNRDTAREVALYHMLGIDKRLPLHHPRQKLVLSLVDTGRVLAAYYGRKRGQRPRTQQESMRHG